VKKQPRQHRSLWGIETGMIVTTSYGTGPYVITEIAGPYLDGTISLVCDGAPGSHYERVSYGSPYFLNYIRPGKDGVYPKGGGDSIFVAPNPNAAPRTLSLFELLSEVTT
jgi:hypothetical protein